MVRERVRTRSGHYAGVSLIESQFAALELPTADERHVTLVDATQPVAAVIVDIVERING